MLLSPQTVGPCLVFLCILQVCISSPTFLITCPKYIHSHMNTTLTVTLLGTSPSVVEVIAEIFHQNTTLVSATGDFTKGSIGTLVIPAVTLQDGVYSYELVVNGFTEKQLLFSNRTFLTPFLKKISTFIQTDKSLYKPGQGVKIRIVSVYPDLKPYPGKLDIIISNPQGYLVQQWLAVEPTYGVISREFQLSENPPFGNWLISIAGNDIQAEKIFSVAEYVLPKFEVIVETQSTYLLTKKEGINGTVTARYTYGKSVKGNATVTLTLNPNYYFYNEDSKQTNITKTFEISGSGNFSVSSQELLDVVVSLQRSRYFYESLSINVSATVTESLTGITQNASTSIGLTSKEYQLNFFDYCLFFKPSMNYTTYLRVLRYDNKSLSANERQNQVAVTIIQTNNMRPWYSVMNKRAVVFEGTTTSSWNDNLTSYSALETSKTINYTIPENGIIRIEFPVHKETTLVITEATFLSIQTSLHVYASYKSVSNAYIKIHEPLSTAKVGSPIDLILDSSEPVTEAYYLVVARGQTLAVGRITAAKFTLTPDNSWAPSACIIVYYIHNNSGEVVHDVLTLPVQDTFKNKVTLSWSKAQVTPSDNVSLNVNVAEPMSLVRLLVVDKSAKLLADMNDITADMVLKDLMKYNQYYSEYYGADSRIIDESPFYFEKCNILVLTDAVMPTDLGNPVPSITDEFGNNDGLVNIKERPSGSSEPHVRTYFPETWLWLDIITGSATSKTLNVTVPDTITTWVASAFVMSENLGLGLTAEPAQLKSFQPFFVSLNLPYSIIRGEQFILEITIFNYLESFVEVTVTLQLNESFDILSSNNNTVANQYMVSVPSQDGKTVLFPIKPKQLGEIPFTVKATSSAASDAVTQTILVKAEGIAQSFSQTVLLDLLGTESQSISKTLNFTFPPNVVNGSETAYVTAIGDILGPSITGLESLIQMPYGCGEQNMINFAPNIYILTYLIVTKQDKENIRQKALTYMEQGYQRELTYSRQDGSFSAFGNSDSSGSTWLTAFVIRCFLQARPYMAIEDLVLSNAVKWLMMHQQPSGEFWEPGRVIHVDLQGGQNGPITLTAYVVITVLENNINLSSYGDAVSKAVRFLEQKVSLGITDNYALSIVTYALSLASSSNASTALNQLNQRATKQGGMQFWTSSSLGLSSGWQPRSADIELAAYALLSHFKLEKIAEGLPIMKWLSQQRNHLGGYSSTQDTIVALQALSQFAVLSNSNLTSLTVSVTEQGLPTPVTFQINSQNLLLLQSKMLGIQQPMSINISALGNGIAVFQLNIFYNLKSAVAARRKRDTENTEAFELDITVTDDKNDINHVTLMICTRLLPAANISQTGMIIMDVTLPSGFTLVQGGISTNDLIKKVEEDNNKLYLYLDSLNATQVCINIPAIRNSKVANAQDGIVNIYDYYEPRRRTVRTYASDVLRNISSCEFCGKDCSLCKTNVKISPADPTPQSSSSLTLPLGMFGLLIFVIGNPLNLL